MWERKQIQGDHGTICLCFLVAMESPLRILGSSNETVEVSVVSSSVPDEAAQCLDSISGTIDNFLPQGRSICSLESTVRP